MDANFKITDKNGRILITIKDDKILVGRYVDMDEGTKQIVTEFYSELTGLDSKDIKKFLDFDGNESEFCS